MFRRIKTALALACTMLLAVGVGVFAAACTNDSKDPVDYKIQVNVITEDTETESAIYSAIKVQLLDTDFKPVTEKVPVVNYMAIFNVAPATYLVSVTGLESFPTFHVEEELVVKADKRNVTVRISEEEVRDTIAYAVTVKLPGGQTVGAGLRVQMCVKEGQPGAGTCTGALTNANGVATFNLPDLAYEVHIDADDLATFGLANYTFDNSAFVFNGGGGSLNVTLQAK